MKKYTLVLESKVKKQLKKLPKHIAKALKRLLDSLVKNPRPRGHKKLKGENLFCIRKGVYRVIYNILEAEVVVVVLAVGHRKDIYEKNLD